MKVIFNSPEEFMEELEKTIPEKGIVRLTFVFKPSSISPSIESEYVVGTAIAGGYLVRLDVYCGDTLSRRAVAVMQALKDKAKELNLEVRAGVFEE